MGNTTKSFRCKSIRSPFTILFTFHQYYKFCSAKLGPDNYFIWRDQFETILISVDLFGYVDGEIREPPREVIVDGSVVINPRWLYWRKVDRFVASCFKATFTDTISGDVLGLSSATEIWIYLETSFRNQFSARRNMLHNQLSGIRKGNLSILVYLQTIKTLADSLAVIGERVSEADLTMCVLNGLSRTYDNFVISANNRETPFTFAELKPRLLNHEQWLLDQEQDMSNNFDPQHPSAFCSRNINHFGGGAGNKGKPKSSYGNFMSSQYQSGSSSSSSTVERQICRKFGHFANRCYYRYAPDKKQNNTHAAHIASEDDGFQYMDSSANATTMELAFSGMTIHNNTMSDPSSSSGPTWIFDSGATSHMTGDQTLMQNVPPYTGKEKVMVGNAKKFPDHIAHMSVKHPICSGFSSLLTSHPEPKSFKEAAKEPKWLISMKEEKTALDENGTWDLVKPTPGMNILGCKWVYKVKLKADGIMDRLKSRLATKGYNQLDVVFSNAFLHGDLTENVYMQQPPGFVDPNFPDHVCHLKKSLYGLKQAPRQWANMLDCKPCDTPVAKTHMASINDDTLLDDPLEYRAIVGGLKYLTHTRPDICFGVNYVSQFMHAPTDCHLLLVKRILRYLKGSIGQGLTLHSGDVNSLKAYTNSDWAGCPDIRRSTSGYAIFLGVLLSCSLSSEFLKLHSLPVSVCRGVLEILCVKSRSADLT
ncbi:hypothetical protein C5167_024320 [Papaver somniferum]|uniref:Reverse transcriptase Ty1/copia-type domain-containing protein n=1 Tax=Papaver somniferum TaxID=3469 RepID=A0A4Y7JRB7_PAPSO|nr:hypothetical protein C5167_024320 [Papaver somniferum]